MVVLGYFEMPKAEVPDEKIWHNAERLREHFEAVDRRRESDTDSEAVPPAEDVDMTQNELARELRGER